LIFKYNEISIYSIGFELATFFVISIFVNLIYLKVCADTVDCYSGQICQAGRCVFQSGYGGLGALSGYGLTGGYSGIGYGGLGVGGLGYGTDPALAASGLYSPYGLGSLTCGLFLK
jgi:hypothetical protein